VDFEALKAQNEDIVGWIYCPDTKINYPVVQGDSNQEYLYKTHTGVHNANGSIFMDFRNLPDFSDFNNILYGHHMSDGGMFATLKKYNKQEFYEAHPTMWLLTPDKAFRLDLIAAMVTPSDSETYELYSYIDDLHERLEYNISKSMINAGEVDISAVKQIVTMSTCTYEYATARFVVIGSMVEVGYPEPPESTEP
jgi:sortase B